LLPKIVGYFKMNSAKRINAMRRTPGVPVWQRNFYERVLRGRDELPRARGYITHNPAQWAADRENPERAGKRDAWEAFLYGEASG
jgi:putative transposase